MQKKSKLKVGITLITIGLCWSIVYIVPFIQYIWYDPFQQMLGCTNTQMGLLITIYGFGNVIGAPIGGWVADHFNYKIVYVGSVLLNGIFSFLFVLRPTYTMAILMWVGFAVASLFMNYPTHIKIVRNLGDDKDQGKLFGLNETCIGIGNILFNSVMMILFTKFMQGVGGMKAAIIGIGVLSLVLTVIAWFVVDNPGPEQRIEKDKSEKGSALKDFGKVIKNPATWLVGITIFAVYSFLNTLTYLTPYFTSVLGVTVVFSGGIAILRQHGMTLLGAPLGGLLTDTIKSPSKVLLGVYAVGIAGFIYLINMKHGTSAGILIAVTLILSLAVYIGRGSYYAVISETNVSRQYTASTIGIAAALGFSPDLFQFTLYGSWLDSVGNQAYTWMFIFQLIVLCIGAVCSICVLRMKKKNQSKVLVAENEAPAITE